MNKNFKIAYNPNLHSSVGYKELENMVFKLQNFHIIKLQSFKNKILELSCKIKFIIYCPWDSGLLLHIDDFRGFCFNGVFMLNFIYNEISFLRVLFKWSAFGEFRIDEVFIRFFISKDFMENFVYISRFYGEIIF